LEDDPDARLQFNTNFTFHIFFVNINIPFLGQSTFSETTLTIAFIGKFFSIHAVSTKVARLVIAFDVLSGMPVFGFNIILYFKIQR
jgi:hypothetical protein